MPAPSETLCPIDEHGCQNTNCLFSPHFPACLQAGHALAPALAFLESQNRPLDRDKLETIRKITDLLGVNNELFLERLYEWIDSQKPK
jgi:hypothetical protein